MNLAAAMSQSTPIAIIAGGGQLPLSVAKSATESGREVFILALEGFSDPAVEAFPHKWVRIGQFAEGVRAMRAARCRELVMIGHARRPARWRVDFGLSFLWTLLTNLDLLWSGDSTLLSKIVHGLEREGFVVRGAHEIAPQLLMPTGVHGRFSPNTRDERDIAIGINAARQLGALDIGQGVVVARGRVLGVEAAEGTDALLERVAGLRRPGQPDRVGVLVKWPQPIQDLRIDMPTIGKKTVSLATAAGLAGIAVAGDRVLAVELEELIRAADESGLFVMGCNTIGNASS